MKINSESDGSSGKDQENNKDETNKWESNQGTKKVFGGLLLIVIGCLFLAREMGLSIPWWLFSWQMLLIVIGFYLGVKHQFQKVSWLILVLIGSASLVGKFLPFYNLSNYIWPIVLIIIGLYTIAKPKSKFSNYKKKWERRNYSPYNIEENKITDNFIGTRNGDYLELNSVFGNIKKNIISKDFKGGEVNCVFGGAEINLSQADITGVVELELNAVLGGIRIIVPPHWEIKSELTAVMGGAEDKRQNMNVINNEPNKFLILRGTALFGGIDIRSY
jgi:predicted membrane protein